ncbi:MAG: anaerobic ribonucleoside-triphosphate reductase [Bacilli bacterium]
MEKSVLETIIVVKRSGQRVPFNKTKIAIAIKKGFDSVYSSYDEDNVNKVFNRVLVYIEKQYENRKTIGVEDVQDIIEVKLQEFGFYDVYKSFNEYRIKRKASRELFSGKQDHKFAKAIQSLKINEEMCESPSNALNNIAVTITKEYARTYLIDNKYLKLCEEGKVYIHDIEYLPVGLMSCINVDILKSLSKTNKLNYHYTLSELLDFMYTSIICMSKELVGYINFSSFDYDISYGILNTFKKELINKLEFLLTYEGFNEFINTDKLYDKVMKISEIDYDYSIFDEFNKKSDKIKLLISSCYNNAVIYTTNNIYKLIDNFFDKINDKNLLVSINIGSCITYEGILSNKNIINVLKSNKYKYPKVIFKVKSGINYTSENIGYNLYDDMTSYSLTNNDVYFSFLDAPFNKSFYKKNVYRSEVSYNPIGERVIGSSLSVTKNYSYGRGNISTVSINMPRIALESNKNIREFYKVLDETMDNIKNILLLMFEIKSNKNSKCFKGLLENNILLDADKIEENERVRKSIKHSNLSINIVGMYECLYLMNESNKVTLGKEILKHMRKLTDMYSDENKLNFVLCSLDESNAFSIFARIDKSIYGTINNVNDDDCYTNSFKDLSLEDRIKYDCAFHSYLNGGHICFINKNKIKSKTYIKTLLDKCYKADAGLIKFYK